MQASLHRAIVVPVLAFTHPSVVAEDAHGADSGVAAVVYVSVSSTSACAVAPVLVMEFGFAA